MVVSKKIYDPRGSLTKIEKIPPGFVVQQALVSKTSRAGTRRGLHHAENESSEQKIITCVKGSMLWISLTTLEDKCAHLRTHLLKSESESSVFMERGLVHGCISLEDNTELLIVSDRPYNHSNSTYYNIDEVESYLHEQKHPLNQYLEALESFRYNKVDSINELPWKIVSHEFIEL